MKKLYLLIILCCSLNMLYAQVSNVTIQSLGNDGFNLCNDPGIATLPLEISWSSVETNFTIQLEILDDTQTIIGTIDTAINNQNFIEVNYQLDIQDIFSNNVFIRAQVNDGANIGFSNIETIAIVPVPNAGSPVQSLQFCLGDNTSIDLFGYISGQSANGIWTDDFGISDLTGSVFNVASIGVTGSYTFTHTVESGNCISTTQVIIFINDLPLAGENTNATVCEPNSLTLEAFLNGTVDFMDVTKQWSQLSGATVQNLDQVNGILDLFEGAYGTYQFQIEVTDNVSGCVNSSILTLDYVPSPEVIFPTENIIIYGDSTQIDLSDFASLITYNSVAIFNWTIAGSGLGSIAEGTQNQQYPVYNVDPLDSLISLELVAESADGCIDLQIINFEIRSDNDYQALRAFYNASNGDTWIDNSGWFDLGSDINTWFGISTNEQGRVIEISLSNNGMTGTLTDSVSLLTELQYLQIGAPGWPNGRSGSSNRNAMAGTIPASIGTLTNLIGLDLSSNDFTSLPDMFTNLTQMEELRLMGNLFVSQQIPNSIFNAANLRIFRIGNAGFEGTISSNFNSLTNLEEFSIGRNSFIDSLPDLSALVNLREFDSEENNFIGSFPDFFQNMSNLQSVVMGFTNYDPSPFPSSLYGKTALQGLFIGYANLTGEIKDSLLLNSSLTNINLAGNNFDKVPDFNGFSNLSNVTQINFSENRLQFGDIETNFIIPEFFYANQKPIIIAEPAIDVYEGNGLLIEFPGTSGANNSYQWEKDGVDISGQNSLTLFLSNLSMSETGEYRLRIINSLVNDSIYTEPYQVNVLENFLKQDSLALREFYNNISGLNWDIDNQAVTNWQGVVVDPQINRVTQLNLFYNNLTGSISPAIGDLDSLTNLYLYGNDLSGSIPASLGKLTQLSEMNLSENLLSGTLPDSLQFLSNLIILALDNNQLDGTVPEIFNNMSSLNSLRLNFNQFSGALPASLAALSNLNQLELQSNEFTEIPDLTALPSLSGLYIEDNRFDFDQIEKNLATPAFYSFGNQKPMLLAQQKYIANPGDTILIDATTGGSNNAYRLLSEFNVSVVGPQADPLLSFENVQPADAGMYYYSVTSAVTGLEADSLISEQFELAFQPFPPVIDYVVGTGPEEVTVGFTMNTTVALNGYGVLRADAEEGPYILVEEREEVAAEYVDSSPELTANTTYWYRMYQFSNENGNSDTTAAVSASTLAPYVLESDSLALAAIYTDMGGTSWSSRSGWLVSPVSQWDGISTVGNRVTAIKLDGFGLSGTLPLIDVLDQLDTLDLSNNFDITDISNLDFTNHPNLIALGLQGINYSGQALPPGLFDLSQLKDLHIADVGFVGSVPSTPIGWNMPVTISMGNNQIDGNVFDAIINPDSLVYLGAYNNLFSGSLPDFIGYNLLETLDLSSNSYSGALPESMGNLPSLTKIYLGNNQLTGNLPASFANLTSLTEFFIENNQLSGAFPDFIDQWSNIAILQLSDNGFSGEINQDWSALSNFQAIGLSNNQLEGAFPLIDALEFKTLVIDGNNFTSLPVFPSVNGAEGVVLANNNQLTFADFEQFLLPEFVEGDNFTYAPQQVLGDTSYLSFREGDEMTLSASLINGTNLTYTWYKDAVELIGENAQNLTISALELSDAGGYTVSATHPDLTALTSEMQPFIVHVGYDFVEPADSLALVAFYNATDGANWTDNTNWLTGNVEDWLGVTVVDRRVRVLEMQFNNLNGSLPEELAGLDSLEVLNLSNNNLSGTIPELLNTLENLQILGLAGNQLTSLPDFSALTNLIELSVSNNQISMDQLEPNAGIANFFYSPQTINLPQLGNQELLLGENFIADASIAGLNNEYQWFKNGDSLANTAILEFAEIVVTDNAAYSVVISNPLLPDLTFNSTVFSIFTNPVAPFGVLADSIASDVILLTVDLDVDMPVGVDEVILERAANQEGPYAPINSFIDLPLQFLDEGLSQNTDYFYRAFVTNSVGNSDFSPVLTVTTLTDNTQLEADSLALVALYQSTNGTEWNTNTNWLSGNVSDWYGVTVENFAVVELQLPANNLQGTINAAAFDLPSLRILNLSENELANLSTTDFSQLTRLEELYLQQNNLADLGNINQLPSTINMLFVEGNRLDFAELEKCALLNTSVFNAMPQQLLTVASEELVTYGESYSQTISLGGSANVYRWTQNMSILADQQTETLSIENFNLSNEGAYQLEVESSFPGMEGITLYSAFTTLLMTNMEADSIALVAFYQATEGENWTNNTGWMTESVANWEGISTVDNRYVTAINLASNNLTGQVPDSWSLPFLTTLNLATNQLSGAFSIDGMQMPNLTNVNLRANDITALFGVDELANLSSLNVIDNRLSFGYLEPFESLTNFQFAPQRAIPIPSDQVLDLEQDFIVDLSISGTQNSYQWFKDGEAIEGANTVNLSIIAVTKADEGFYSLEINSSINFLADLTLRTSAIELKVSTLERDMNALRALYNSTGGNNWSSVQWNINEADIANWGAANSLVIENSRVVEVLLPNNNLQGDIPLEVSEMLGVRRFDFANNGITSLPRLNQMPLLTNLNVSGNQLKYPDILRNLGIANFNFTNQSNVRLNDSNNLVIRVGVGENANFFVNTPGAGNTYQWFKEDQMIEGANSASLTVNAVDFEKMGNYRVAVGNSTVNAQFPDFRINSQNGRLIAFTDIAGNVVDRNDNPVNAGIARLFRIRSDASYDTVRFEGRTFVDLQNGGTFEMNTVDLGDYLMFTRPNAATYPDLLPTYFPNTIDWDVAEVVQVRESNQPVTIVAEGTPAPPQGVAQVFGNIQEETEDEDGRLLRRRAVSGAGVSIRTSTTITRDYYRVLADDGFQLVAYVESDDEGNFDFPLLPEGSYRIRIDLPGIPMNEESEIDFEIRGVQGEELELFALVEEGQINVDRVRYVAVDEARPDFVKAYPIPVNAFLQIINERPDFISASIFVYDNNGSLVKQIDQIQSRELRIEMSDMNQGIYLIKMMTETVSGQKLDNLRIIKK